MPRTRAFVVATPMGDPMAPPQVDEYELNEDQEQLLEKIFQLGVNMPEGEVQVVHIQLKHAT